MTNDPLRLTELEGCILGLLKEFACRYKRAGVVYVSAGGHPILENAFRTIGMPDPVPLADVCTGVWRGGIG